MNMISKHNLKGKHVTYIDKDDKIRTNKVTKVVGNFLTVINVVGVKHRIHKDRILGRQFRKKGMEEIKW